MAAQHRDGAYVRPWLDEEPDAIPGRRFARRRRRPSRPAGPDDGPSGPPRPAPEFAHQAPARVPRRRGGDGGRLAAPNRRHAGLRAAFLVAAVAAAGVAGYAVSQGTGGSDQAGAPDALTATSGGTIRRGGLALTPPTGWTPEARPPRMSGLSIPDAIVLHNRALDATAVTGMLAPSSSTLLPDWLVASLVLRPGLPAAVRIGPTLRGLHYEGLWHSEWRQQIDVWAVPTTKGVATLVCLADAGTVTRSDCSRVAATLDVAPAKPLEPRADTGFRLALPGALRRLDERRARARQELGEATAASTQAAAVERAGEAYGAVAGELRGLVPGSEEWPDRVVAALEQVQRAYGELAGALRSGAADAVTRAQAAVLSSEDAFERVLQRGST